MSKIIAIAKKKLNNGQSIFRRSTVEQLVAEYERLLARNVYLEKYATEPVTQADAAPAGPQSADDPERGRAA